MLLFSAVCGALSGSDKDQSVSSSVRAKGLGTKLLLGIAIFSCWAATVPAYARRSGRDVAVVGNGDLPVANLSLPEVRRLFLGETRYWKKNLPVVLIVPPVGTHERDVLLHNVYRMSEVQFKQYWIRRILRGQAVSAPKTADSVSAAQKLVASLPGGVTVLSSNRRSKKTRVLKTDGKSPGEKEYPLR
jgi:hypothetical protein